jgi:hypothetical protein
MAEKNPFSAVGAAQKLQRRQGEVKAAIEKQTGSKSKKKTKRVTRKKGATTYAEAKRTKHRGSEGEVAYGQRMGPSPMETKRKSRFKEKSKN